VHKRSTKLATEPNTAGTPIILPALKGAFARVALIRGLFSLSKPVYVFCDSENRQFSDLHGGRAGDNKASRSLSPI
jgi:hypothetical protein